jgi:hypothetical protein
MIRVAFVMGDYPPDERALRQDMARSAPARIQHAILGGAPASARAPSG